jgi:hypothetical protein
MTFSQIIRANFGAESTIHPVFPALTGVGVLAADLASAAAAASSPMVVRLRRLDSLWCVPVLYSG